MNRPPAFQFYPADWRKDPGVQALSLSDRMIWFEMLCVMHESERRGVLVLNGKAISLPNLARILHVREQKVISAVNNILELGVASKEPETGAIFSRRMVRDERLSEIRRAAGLLGGNPDLVKQKASKRQAKAKQKPTPSSSSSFSSATSVLENPSDSLPGGADKPRARCESFDLWAKLFEQIREAPYQDTKADFTQLARLRAAYKLNGHGIPPRFEEAVRNYLASPLTKYSLMDLCSRYDVFLAGEVDRFGKPVGHSDVRQHNMAAARKLAARGFFDE